MSLAVFAWLFGEKKAEEIANYTEYVCNKNSDQVQFHKY